MKERLFYIIKEDFFEKMADPYLKGNKEENRPHYYCFKENDTGLMWMIPLSSRIEKYKRIIQKREKHNRQCDILHIAKLDDDKEAVFLIQDMFPVTEQYIAREYTISKNPLVLTSEHTVKEIERKAKRILSLINRGKKLIPTQVDVNSIINKLKE